MVRCFYWDKLGHKVEIGMPCLYSELQPSESQYPKMFSISLLYQHRCPHNHSYAWGKSAVFPEKTNPTGASHPPPAEGTSLLHGWSIVMKLCAAQLQREPFTWTAMRMVPLGAVPCGDLPLLLTNLSANLHSFFLTQFKCSLLTLPWPP